MPLFKKVSDKLTGMETIGEKLATEEEKAKMEQLTKLIEYPQFGLTHFLKKDCPNEKHCFSVSVGDKTLAHQLCAICWMLQQQIILLKNLAAQKT